MGALRRATADAPPGEQASVAAAFWMVTYLGAGLTVAGVGLLAAAVGLVAAVDLFAAAMVAACLGLLAASGRSRPPR
jgi:hypothetical protein